MKIVWDWNGTLYDDIDQGFTSINRLLDKYELPRLQNHEAYREVFDFPVIDYYRRVGFDFDKLDWDQVAHEFMDHYNAQVPDIRLFEDVIPSLERVRSQGNQNVILSASQIDALKDQIAPFGIEGLIDEIYGISNIYAHSKAELARELREKSGPQERIVFIGDTLHDVQVADEIGAEVLLVDRGHQSRARLEKSGKPVFSSLAEALDYLENESREGQ